jgi:hypothetical protein
MDRIEERDEARRELVAASDPDTLPPSIRGTVSERGAMPRPSSTRPAPPFAVEAWRTVHLQIATLAERRATISFGRGVVRVQYPEFLGTTVPAWHSGETLAEAYDKAEAARDRLRRSRKDDEG